MNKVMEYMALGKPLVAFDLTETRESAGDCARYARPNDELDFARQVVALLDDPETCARLGRMGQERVAQQLAWEHSVPQLLRAYAEGLGARPGARADGGRAAGRPARMRRAMDTSMLPGGFSVEVDTIDEAGWHALLDRFADASLYQAWAWKSAAALPGRSSRLVVRRDGEVVAAAQARVVRLPLLPLGVAYVRWGPMWRLRGRRPEPAVLAAALRALRDEYTLRRGLSLRVLPYLFDDEPALAPWRCDTGFVRRSDEIPQRTLLMPIDVPLAMLRARMDQKWRNGLNRAERHALHSRRARTTRCSCASARSTARCTRARVFVRCPTRTRCARCSRACPSATARACSSRARWGSLAAGVVCSQIGESGLYLHGATSNAGMQTQASYLLQWRVLQWLQQRGALCLQPARHRSRGESGHLPLQGRPGRPRVARPALPRQRRGGGRPVRRGSCWPRPSGLRRAWRDTRPTGPRLDAGR
jgi:hypothetical protein